MAETNNPDLWRGLIPWPGADAHKHRRGRLGVVAGGPLNTGAARLAARAGLRVGAGLVKVLAAPDAAAVVAGALEAVMVEAFETPAALAEIVAPMQAVVIGPAAGLTEGTVANLRALAGAGPRLVVDADALTVFQRRADELFDLVSPDDVLTPHEGEFERLFPGLLSSGRTEAAQTAARRAGCIVVLKGCGTVTAAPDGRIRLNPNGSPWLATAGSGDVLCGLIGGLMAQGMATFEAASAAVWMHGDAAARFGPGLIAEDLPDLMPAVLKDLR